MPCPFKVISVIFDQPLQAVKVSGVEAIIVGYANIRMNMTGIRFPCPHSPQHDLIAWTPRSELKKLYRYRNR